MTENQLIKLSDYKPSPFLVPNIKLDINITSDEVQVLGELKIVSNKEFFDSCPRELFLDGIDLNAHDFKINGVPLPMDQYKILDEGLLLTVPADAFTKPFTFSCRARLFPKENKSLNGFFSSKAMICTQCEPEGFRRIFYSFDRTDILSVYDVSLSADKKQFPYLLSNGNKVSETSLGGGMHRVVWHDPHPKPSYLFAVAAGNFAHAKDTFNSRSGREFGLDLFVEPGMEDQMEFALESMKLAMQWDEDVFDLIYDLDRYMIVAVSDFNGGAMENKGLNIFNSKFVLASKETATDDQIRDILGVIGHEYFHNYTGNRVTLRDWFQLSLKEGLTVYRDQEFSKDMGSEATSRVNEVISLMVRQFPEDSSPMAHPVKPKEYLEIGNFYTPTVYEKGAELIRMIECLLGKNKFIECVKHYLKENDGKACTTEDFIASMRMGAPDVNWDHFSKWYDIPGTPSIKVEEIFNKTDNTYTLAIEQSNPVAKSMGYEQALMVPLRCKWLGNSKQVSIKNADCLTPEYILDAPAGQFTIVLNQPYQKLVWKGVGEKPVISINRQFMAPINLDFRRPMGQMLEALRSEDDAYCLWQGYQNLYYAALGDLLEGKEAADKISALQELISEDLSSLAKDLELIALCMTPPTFSMFLARFEKQGYVAVRTQYLALMAAIFNNPLEPLMLKVLKQVRGTLAMLAENPSQEKLLDNKMVAHKKLAVCLMKRLCYLKNLEAIEIAKTSFSQADNMSEELGAFEAILSFDYNAGCEAAVSFEKKWSRYDNVIDSMLHSMCQVEVDFAENYFHYCLKHPHYDDAVPNRCRAVLGGFARGNAMIFHEGAGKNYDLYAEKIIKIDGFNSQLASALGKLLINFRGLPKENLTSLQRAFEKIMAKPNLSKDLQEVIGKARESLRNNANSQLG